MDLERQVRHVQKRIVILLSTYQTTFSMSECIRTLKLTMAFNRICWYVCKLVAQTIRESTPYE